MENSFSLENIEQSSEEIPVKQTNQYNIRPCPSCGNTLFGMPGGRDAICRVCGFKDPCCSD